MLSWSVFWMDKSLLGDRLSISFIGILTVVSYQILLGETLPRIAYFTLTNVCFGSVEDHYFFKAQSCIT